VPPLGAARAANCDGAPYRGSETTGPGAVNRVGAGDA
jgi:hypothetical protein